MCVLRMMLKCLAVLLVMVCVDVDVFRFVDGGMETDSMEMGDVF